VSCGALENSANVFSLFPQPSTPALHTTDPFLSASLLPLPLAHSLAHVPSLSPSLSNSTRAAP